MFPSPHDPVKASVDEQGFVTADGVKIGKLVETSTGYALQVCDKDRRSAAERGCREVQVDLQSLAQLEKKEDDTRTG